MLETNHCTNDTDRYDVIIIGAGLSGLYAAQVLKEHGVVNFLVLEARDRVGGRLLTKHDPQVGYVDLGGSYVGPSQFFIQGLIRKLNLKTYKINTKGKSVYLNSKRRYLHDGDRLPSLTNKLVEFEIKHILELLSRMSEELSRDEPWLHPRAHEWDRQTFGQFLDRHCWSQEAKDFISIYIGCCTSCEAYEESLLWTLWYIRQCDGLETMYQVENSAQDSKLIGGTQQICERLLEEVGEAKVCLNKPVVQLIIKDDYQMIETLDGQWYKCRFTIIAMPPVLWQKIRFDPPLPPIHNQMVQKFTMGSAIKCIVYYQKAFWRDRSLNGNMLINCTSELGPITYTVDDTKPDGTYPAIVGFIIGDRARDMLQRTKEDRLRFICESYARAFETEEALNPVHYEEKNWMAEQYTGGCFTGLGAPGFLTSYGPLLTKPLFECIFPAGTETSMHWAGYMDGALQAAHRAASQTLKKLNIPIFSVSFSSDMTRTFEMVDSFHLKSNINRVNQLKFNPSINQLLTWSSIAVALLGSIIVATF